MKVTLITGASGGIGEAIANRLAKRKHNLFLVARNELKLKTLATQMANDYQISVEYMEADLSKAGVAQKLFEETQSHKVEIEMLINNAGIGSGGEFENCHCNQS